jgi:hypothetical protein
MIERSLTLLRAWADYAEKDWYDLPHQPGLGCYGTGYNAWGVQTNQKYLAALAVLSAHGGRIAGVDAGRARTRALSALRFSLWCHKSGEGACTDGTQWGHTWISALGVERMMHAVHLLRDHLTPGDRAALRRVLVSESDHLLNHYRKYDHGGPTGALWDHTRHNEPESNIWNGALLWRTAAMYPDEAHASVWQERAHHFLMNGVSIPADATDEPIIAGRRVRDWHVGPNFFPNYALDHHGYLNVGYMVICVSNAAMLHFDLQRQGLAAPQTLHHHQKDLWQVLRRMIFSDGRLARLGGDTRIRYAYCQDFLMPALLYAAEHLADPHAMMLLEGQLQWIEHEAQANGDGSFYSKRLGEYLSHISPYYTTRLESDRANALGMVVEYLSAIGDKAPHLQAASQRSPATTKAFEASVQGGWCEPEHGAVMHRCPTRLASFSWRASGLAQGLCLPPHDGHLAEWWHNLAGVARFMGDDGTFPYAQSSHRRLGAYTIDTFDGGFVTCGHLLEGVDLTVPEGWSRKGAMATHHLALAALPDGHTMVGLQLVRIGELRAVTLELKGMQLNIPNDLFNNHQRVLSTARGDQKLSTPPEADATVDLASRWASIDGKLSAMALYGQPTLTLHRSAHRRGGKFHTLFTEELCVGCAVGPVAHDAGAVILDVGWAVMSSVDAARTQAVAEANAAPALAGLPHDARGVRVTGLDGKTYTVLANFGDKPIDVRLNGQPATIAAGSARVL